MNFLTNCNCGSRLSSPRPAPEKPVRPAQQGQRPPCPWTATAKSRWSADRRNHGDLPLRHDRDAKVDRNGLLNKLQLWDLNDLHDQHLRNLHDPHTRDKDHLVNGLQLRNLHGQLDGRHHGDLLLQHDRDGEDLVDKLRLRDNDGITTATAASSPPSPTPSGNPLWGSRAPPQTDVMLTAVSLYRAQGSAGAWVSSPEGGRHATATPSGQQLPKECRPSSDPARCPCRPLGPPATVTPGRLLASLSGAKP